MAEDRNSLMRYLAPSPSPAAPAVGSDTLRQMGHSYLNQMQGAAPAGFAANTIMGFGASPAIVGAPGAAARAAALADKGNRLQAQIDSLGIQIANARMNPEAQRRLIELQDALLQEMTNVSRQEGLRIAPHSRFANPNLDR